MSAIEPSSATQLVDAVKYVTVVDNCEKISEIFVEQFNVAFNSQGALFIDAPRNIYEKMNYTGHSYVVVKIEDPLVATQIPLEFVKKVCELAKKNQVSREASEKYEEGCKELGEEMRRYFPSPYKI